MERATPAKPTLADLASATPEERDRFLDLLRAGSILVVVLGHWLMAAVVREHGLLRAENALAAVPALQPLTWVLQVMPVFFFVSACTHARALQHTPTAVFLARRAARLLPPTVLLVLAWTLLAAVLGTTSLADATVRDATSVAAQPLWFLAVYLLLVLVAPAQLRLHRRHPWLVLVAAPASAVLLDTARLNEVGSGFAALSYLAVFSFAQELGFHYADGAFVRLSRAACGGAAAGGVGALVLLTAAGPYPVSMVGVPGERVSNMSPPTVCVAVVTVVQLGLLLAARPWLLRWAEWPRVWLATVAVNAVVLSVFLWHLSAFVVASALLAGPLGLTGPPGTAGWWAAKPAYVLLAAVVLALLVRVVSPIERRRQAPSVARPGWVVAAGVLAAGVGLAGVAASGFVAPLSAHGRAVLGLRFSPAVAIALLLLGSWLTASRGPSYRGARARRVRG